MVGRSAAAVFAAAALVALSAVGVPVSAEPDQPPPPAEQPPLLPLQAAEAPQFDAATLQSALAPLLADPALGADPGVVVLDGVTGQTLLDQRADGAVIPASSLKIATGLAALASLGPQHVISTKVVRDGTGIVLVGGGDPTLLTVPAPTPPVFAPPATLSDLAAKTAAALQAAGETTVQVRYDASLFTGPALSSDWDPTFVGLGIISPVSALTVDPASREIDARALDADPAGATAAWFVARLNTLGITANLVAAGTADPTGQEIASVDSAPISALVDRMLDISDNDVAEALFRLAAIGEGLPGSFDGGTEVVQDTFAELQVPTPGLVIRDGSGLSRENRIAPITLAASLQIAIDPQAKVVQDPSAGLGAVTWLPPGLPVGGFTGSLDGRFDSAATAAGAGRVHAKTGTLTGVTSLSGVVATDQERPAVFVVLGNETADTLAARDALDKVAARIAACGCTTATP